MMLDSMFENFKTITAEYENKTDTVVDGMITGETWTLAGSVEALIYRGALAEKLVSEKLRPDVSAVILVKPEDYPEALTKDSRVLIESIYYNVIYADNIAEQDKVIMIPLKLIDNPEPRYVEPEPEPEP